MKDTNTITTYANGFLLAYTILISLFAAGMYNGRIASISQACVERTTVAPADFVSQLEGR